MGKIFASEKKIRLGIWGLGRGRASIEQCKELNIEIVAGCDINEMMRRDFGKLCPDAFITGDENEFLACDMDAVLVATYFFDHANCSIKALNAGKHVLSEVSAFFTPAEGVRLVEAVEKSGKLYMLGENFTDQFVKKLWQDGLFGELAYAEFNYVHECRPLSYSYLHGEPLFPGNTAHSWRSWLNFHYYCTHSLGAAMEITGTRPVSVSAPPAGQTLPGYLPGSEMGCMAPSFVTMDNGGVIRNLMGAATADSHDRCIWGTRAFVDLSQNKPVVRVGQCGRSPKLTLTPPESKLTRLAAKAGHGGGDFYVLYNFANALLNNAPVVWDVYYASDVTLTGIMAVKSQYANGIPMEVPDFRNPAVRDKYRNDNFAQAHLDPTKIFPDNQDIAETKHFSNIMYDLDRAWKLQGAPLVIAAVEGMKLYTYITDLESKVEVQTRVQQLLRDLQPISEAYRQAQYLIKKYPASPAAEALRTLCQSAYPEKLENLEAFRKELLNFLRTCNLEQRPQLQMYVEEEVLQKVQIPPCPEGFTLRTFREGDLENYIELMKESGFHYWSREFADKEIKKALDDGIFFVEDLATGRLAATASAVSRQNSSGEDCGELGWVAVHPDFRGKKLAQVVNAAAMQKLSKSAYRRIFLYTDDFRLPAIKTYLEMNWQPVIMDRDRNQRWDAVFKRLNRKLAANEFNI